jgi:hypothetical protein
MESPPNSQITNQQQIQQMSDQELLDIVKKDTDFENKVLECKKEFKGTNFVIDLHGLPGYSMYTEKTTIEEVKENIKSYIDGISEFKKQIVIPSINANLNVLAKQQLQNKLDVCDVYIAKCNEILQNDYPLKSAIEQKIAIDKEQCPVLSILEDEVIQKNNSIVQTSRGVFDIKINGNTKRVTLLKIGYTHEHAIPLVDQMVDSNKEEEKSSLLKVDKSAFESDSEESSEININLAQKNDRNHDVKKITQLNQYKQDKHQRQIQFDDTRPSFIPDESQFYLYKNQNTDYPFIVEYQNGGKININLPEDTDVQHLTNYIHEHKGNIVIPVKYNFIHPLKGIYPNYQMSRNDELLEADFCEGIINFTFKKYFIDSVEYAGSIPTSTTADGKLILPNQKSIIKGKWNIDNNGNWRAQGDVCIQIVNAATFYITGGLMSNVVIEIRGKTENGLLEGNAHTTIFDGELDSKWEKYRCKDKYPTQIIFTKGEAAKNVQIQKQLQYGRLEITIPHLPIFQPFEDIFHNNPKTVIVHYDKDGNKTSNYTGETNKDFTPNNGLLCYENGDVISFVDQRSRFSPIMIFDASLFWDARLTIKNQDGFGYQFILLPNQSQCIYLSKDYLKIDNSRTCKIDYKEFYYTGEHVNLVPNGDGDIYSSQKVRYEHGLRTKELSFPVFHLEVINVANRIDGEDVSKEEEKSSSNPKEMQTHLAGQEKQAATPIESRVALNQSHQPLLPLQRLEVINVANRIYREDVSKEEEKSPFKPQEMQTHLAGQKKQAVTPIESLFALNQSNQPLPPLQRAVGIYQNQQDYEQQANINVQDLVGHVQNPLQIPNQVTEPQGSAFNTRSRSRDDKTNDKTNDKSFGKK